MAFSGIVIILGIGAGLAFWPDQTPLPTTIDTPANPSVSQVVDSDPQTDLEKPKTTETDPEEEWIEHTIRRGETLTGIFNRYELGNRTLHSLLQSDRHLQKELSRLYPGKTVKILLNQQGQLEKLVYQHSKTEAISAARVENGFDIEKVFQEPQRELRHSTGTIQTSLYLDGRKAGLSDALIMQLTEIYGWDIDFARSIRPGDRFNVLHEEWFHNGERIGDGPIIAAEFTNRGRIYQAIRFTLPDGRSDYYSPDGKTLRKAFLRMPVKSARISSRFNLHRRHPILHRIRAHKGVDYAAPRGTPVHATGDGKIIFRGRKGGYGRVIIIQHGRRYSTLYAHLHRFNSKFKRGSKVKQGDIIAYVGQSGLASGPHLHYEFRINGIHRDPLTVPLPDSKPIPSSLMTTFKQQSAPLLAELAKHRLTDVAQAENRKE